MCLVWRAGSRAPARETARPRGRETGPRARRAPARAAARPGTIERSLEFEKHLIFILGAASHCLPVSFPPRTWRREYLLVTVVLPREMADGASAG